MRYQKELWIHLKRCLSEQRRCLVFLPFRRQVEQWADRIRLWDRDVLSCVGGKTVEFREQLKKMNNKGKVAAVLATDALGHGVNLPPVDDILIAYRVPNRAMWLQMVGRGGRDGRPYRLYCMNTYGRNKLQNVLARVRNIMAVTFSWQRIS